MDDSELLQNMPVFGGIQLDILAFLIDNAPVVTRKNGEIFFRENEPSASMFVLKKGRVAISKNWHGQSHLVRFLGPGDCFGEMSLLDLGPRSATVTAIESCEAIEISSDLLFEIHMRDPDQYTLIQMNMGREVSRRLRDAESRLFDSNRKADMADGAILFHAM
jgi:CRP-like cAMP-binding protein